MGAKVGAKELKIQRSKSKKPYGNKRVYEYNRGFLYLPSELLKKAAAHYETELHATLILENGFITIIYTNRSDAS